jgi:aspartyl-tRNA(Asn)/glutamyl-tRNA(Gln) amidotransferase subunit A
MMHIGTDAAGSIRIPCSFSGIYGLKPTFGRVPTYPASAFVVLSHVGPQTRTVDDAALMMSVIAQPDYRDMMAQNVPAPDYRVGLERGVRGLRIAWSPRLGFVRGLNSEVEELCARAVRVFEELGAIVEEVDPGFSDPRDVILTIWRAGAAAVLRTIPESQHSSMDPGFVGCARVGAELTAADFLSAFNARAALSRQMAEFHEHYDLLLTPTLPLVAFGAGRNTPENAAPGSEWVDWTPYTYPFNLTLQPAATVPCGLTNAGLPVGLQIVGPVRMDDLVLQASKAFESACPFARVEKPRCASKQ